MIVHENRAREFYDELQEQIAAEITPEELEVTAKEKFLHQIQQPGSKFETLMLNFLQNEDIVGGPMPSVITEFENLHTLQAFGMKFTEVPESIGNMENLTQLNLSRNNLTTLPSSIGELSNLKTLNLAKNQLTTLPESIINCKNLKKIVLRENPISSEEMKRIQSWLPKKCKVK